MALMTFCLSSVRMLTEEPKTGNDSATEQDEEHLNPLVMTFVKLCNNDLTAGDINESTSRYSEEGDVNELVAVGNLHANNNADWCNDWENTEE